MAVLGSQATRGCVTDNHCRLCPALLVPAAAPSLPEVAGIEMEGRRANDFKF